MSIIAAIALAWSIAIHPAVTPYHCGLRVNLSVPDRTVILSGPRGGFSAGTGGPTPMLTEPLRAGVWHWRIYSGNRLVRWGVAIVRC